MVPRETKWKVLLVHPSSLMHSEIYLRLEPLGLELIAQACLRAGFGVSLLDLQVCAHKDYFCAIEKFEPDAVGFSLNYLANIPEVVDLAKETRQRRPEVFLFAGGHSASFVAREILDHADSAIDCVVKGEGESVVPKLLRAVAGARSIKFPGSPSRPRAQLFSFQEIETQKRKSVASRRSITARSLKRLSRGRARAPKPWPVNMLACLGGTWNWPWQIGIGWTPFPGHA